MRVYIITTTNVMTTSFYYSLLEKIFIWAGFDVVMCDNIRNYHPDKKDDIIVTGNAYPTVKLWLRGYNNICTWYQGVEPEERKMQGYSPFMVWIHTVVEKISLKKTAFSFFVSKAIKEHYENKYNIQFQKSCYAIIPCFNESRPYKNCFLPNVKKPFSFVYSGGMGVWQCFNETLEVFKRIKERIPEATLAIYTYQVDKAKALVDSNGISGVKVQYIPKEKMNGALADKMFGFVLREDNPVNNVATPTKLSNLTANGVIPICSTSVKDFSEETSNSEFVIHVKSNDIEMITDEVYDGVIRITSNYSSEKHLKEIETLYKEYYSEYHYIKKTSLQIKELFIKA